MYRGLQLLYNLPLTQTVLQNYLRHSTEDHVLPYIDQMLKSIIIQSLHKLLF